MNPGRCRLWIGTAGWQYDDWYGVFFPRVKPRGFQPLRYLSQYFNAVEVNSSFYRIPSPASAERWAAAVPDAFRFTLKLYRSFTHERDTYPPRAERDAFAAAANAIRTAHKLGPLLVQFPWSFRFTPNSVDRISRIADDFSDFERFIEVRHSSWMQPEGLSALKKFGGFCSIDQPVLRDCIGPTAFASNRTAYVRLHGRNAMNWFRTDQPAFERYNYLYSDAEIREWVERLRGMESQADDLYVITNNHYRGQAPANAIELRALFEGTPSAAPAELISAYPRLAAHTMRPLPSSLFE